jgi:hypothetical protein
MSIKKAKEYTQKERLGFELKKIKPDITAADRESYINKFGITKGNLSLYLNGTVYNADKAVHMISFFKNCIKKREQIFA